MVNGDRARLRLFVLRQMQTYLRRAAHRDLTHIIEQCAIANVDFFNCAPRRLCEGKPLAGTAAAATFTNAVEFLTRMLYAFLLPKSRIDISKKNKFSIEYKLMIVT